MECSHPPARRFCWVAIDGVMCIACCDCGEVLKGGVTLDTEVEKGDYHD